MVIGITGFLRSGKDTVANMLMGLDPSFSRYSFADPIKHAAEVMFGWDYKYTYGELKDVVDPYWGISPRLVLQLLGTEFSQYLLCEKSEAFKKITGRTLWVRLFEKKLQEYPTNNWIIPDVRFPHEIEFFSKNNFPIIKVVRKEKIPTGEVHESEKYISSIPAQYIIENDGTLMDLKTNVDLVFSYMKKDYSF